MGEKQFYTEEQLTVPATKLTFDKKTGRFVVKVYEASVPFLWDENRRHFIFSPQSESKKVDDDY